MQTRRTICSWIVAERECVACGQGVLLLYRNVWSTGDSGRVSSRNGFKLKIWSWRCKEEKLWWPSGRCEEPGTCVPMPREKQGEGGRKCCTYISRNPLKYQLLHRTLLVTNNFYLVALLLDWSEYVGSRCPSGSARHTGCFLLKLPIPVTLLSLCWKLCILSLFSLIPLGGVITIPVGDYYASERSSWFARRIEAQYRYVSPYRKRSASLVY
jgi:hypothetical protein